MDEEDADPSGIAGLERLRDIGFRRGRRIEGATVVDDRSGNAGSGDVKTNAQPVRPRLPGESVADDIGHCFIERERQPE